MLSFVARSLWLLWCWIELAIFTVFLYALSWLPRAMTGSYYHTLSRIWCKFLIRALGVNLRLHQKNLNPLPGHYILISNHPSAFEDFGIPSLFDVYPLAKEEVKQWLIIGRIGISANTIYVKREDPESRHKVLDTLVDAVNKGRNVAIFPEGGCKGRRIHSTFQSGAFDVSLKTGVPILPVFLEYEAQETFEWRDPHLLPHKMWHFMTSQNNRANYHVYDAISPEGFSDKREFAEHVRQMYLHWQARYLE